MATVTKPIALDESLNTTELSSRNVADVLAQELSAVATAIGGIAVPSADHVSYDNSVSGLSATDVQNALDEIVSDIPTVNNGTLTIQQNGTSIGSFSANTASNVTANIKTPTADKKTATSEFSTADGGLLSKCIIDLEPVQSGSGDPSPDNVRPISGHTEVDLRVDGKNRLPLVLADIKSANIGGTWSGAVYTINGVTFTVMLDGGGNVVGIKANGTANSLVDFIVGGYFNISASTQYILNGVIGGGATTYRLNLYKLMSGGGNEFITQSLDGDSQSVALSNSDSLIAHIYINQGVQINTTIYPMLRLATETDTTYEPYLGHLYQVQIGSTVYGGYVDLVSGVMTVDRIYLTAQDLIDNYNSYNTTNHQYRVYMYTTNNSIVGNSSVKNSANAVSNIFNCNFSWNEMQSLNGLGKLGVYHDSNWNYTRIYICLSDTITTREDAEAWLTSSGIQLVYQLATPQTIHLNPQQIEALVGENNLSTPLDGQSIETNGVEYKELFTFADVKFYVDKKIPDAPTTDGTYTLQAVVSGGVPTYSWV